MTTFNLDTFLPYRLSLVTNTLSRDLASAYTPYGLTRTQWRIMAVLAGHDKFSAGDIVQKTMMDKTTISRAVKAMTVRKLVRRTAVQTDGRASHLSLTAKGKTLFDKIEPAVLAHEQKIRSKLTASEQKNLERIIDILLNAKDQE